MENNFYMKRYSSYFRIQSFPTRVFIGSSDAFSEKLQIVGKLLTGSRLTYLDLHVVVEKDVPELEISVDDAVFVQVMDALQQLCHVVASLGFSHSLPALVELQQGLQMLQ